MNRFNRELVKPFVGRDEEAKVVTLALMIKEHAVLIGEPGTAKSALIRRAAALLNARYFSYLLTKFTEPDEIFGPVDIKAFIDEKRFRRVTARTLLDAEIAFLDEIFKASSSILNSILSIINERIYYEAGVAIKVPLWSLFAATNEIPDDPELAAIYDRMLLRHHVRPVTDDLWKDLLNQEWINEMKEDVVDVEPVLSMQDLRDLREEIFKVDLEGIKPKLIKLLAILESKGIHLTDRRKGKTLKVIAANAILNNRMKAQEEDLLVLKYTAPRDIDEFEKVNVILHEELKTPYMYLRELEDIERNVKELINYVSSFNQSYGYVEPFAPGARATISRFYEERLNEIYRDLEALKERVSSIIIESGDKNVEAAGKRVLELISSAMEKIRRRIE
ncbi:MAG: AAA family ATPase [Sulfolobales archaeon]